MCVCVCVCVYATIQPAHSSVQCCFNPSDPKRVTLFNPVYSVVPNLAYSTINPSV